MGLLAAACMTLAGGCIDEPGDPAGSSARSSGSSPAAAVALKPRVLPAKPAVTLRSAHLQDDEIIVKFKEGTRVRLRAGALRFEPGSVTARERALLARHGLASDRVARDVSAASALLAPAAI
ncbi:MAG TPA: hypothetical protein VK932_13825, partial [Kofleriaceae bacterium]|nr:hypothetical protein [Kofleriaceae bacterium]